MASFVVRQVFKISSRSLFVMAGDVSDGAVKAGMKAALYDDRGVVHCFPIAAVEFITYAEGYSGGEIALCIQYDDGAHLKRLQSLALQGTHVEIHRI